MGRGEQLSWVSQGAALDPTGPFPPAQLCPCSMEQTLHNAHPAGLPVLGMLSGRALSLSWESAQAVPLDWELSAQIVQSSLSLSLCN